MTAAYTTLWSNYAKVPPLMIFPVLAVASLLTIRFLLSSDSVVLAWVFSALFIISVTFFGVLGMFPNLLPSSMDPAAHVSIYNGASSPLTLKIMLGVVAIFVPIVIAYQAWVYSVFSHKVTDEDLKMDNAY